MKKLSDLAKKWKKDTEFKHEYDALTPEFELAKSIIETRVKRGYTQTELAHKMGTTQSSIARLECGQTIPSFKTILRFAKATGTVPILKFKFESHGDLLLSTRQKSKRA